MLLRRALYPARPFSPPPCHPGAAVIVPLRCPIDPLRYPDRCGECGHRTGPCDAAGRVVETRYLPRFWLREHLARRRARRECARLVRQLTVYDHAG